MKYWGDAKTFLAENLIIHMIGFFSSLLYDFIHTALYSFNLFKEPHPYGFGRLQIGLIVFFGMMLFRAASKWRYYD